MTLFPMTCACCTVNRHDLCAAEDDVSYCECADESHAPVARFTHPGDIAIPFVDNQGQVMMCAPTRSQYLAAAAVSDRIHFVRNQEHTGGGNE